MAMTIVAERRAHGEVLVTPKRVSDMQSVSEGAEHALRKATAARKKAERAVCQLEKKRALLDARRLAVLQSLQRATSSALDAAIENQDFPEAVAEEALLRDQLRIQAQALVHLDLERGPDAKRQLLLAGIAEKDAEADQERARLEHHEAKALLLLTGTAVLNGGIQSYALGGVAEEMRNRVLQLWRELDGLRNALRKHNELTAKARESAKKSDG